MKYFTVIFVIIIVWLLVLSLTGCSVPQETIIRQRTIETEVPEIIDSMAAEVNLPDETIEDVLKNYPDETIIMQSNKESIDSTGRKTNVDIKIIKKTKGNKSTLDFNYNIKQDPVKKGLIDTTKRTNPPPIIMKPPDTTKEKVGGWVIYGSMILVFLGGIFLVFKYRSIIFGIIKKII